MFEDRILFWFDGFDARIGIRNTFNGTLSVERITIRASKPLNVNRLNKRINTH